VEMIFNIQNKTKVKYIINPSNIPLGVFPEIQKYPEVVKKTGCPAVHSIDGKLWYVNSYLDIEIEFGFNSDGNSYFKYEYNKKIHPNVDAVHDMIKQNIFLNTAANSKKNYLDLQVGTPYAFVTDDKELEVNTLPVNIQYENCIYVPGGLKPANWIRTLNSAYLLDDFSKPAKIKLNIDKPILSFHFNKPIDLEYTEYKGDIKDYHQMSNGIVNYRRKLENSVIKTIIKKRKNKLL